MSTSVSNYGHGSQSCNSFWAARFFGDSIDDLFRGKTIARMHSA